MLHSGSSNVTTDEDWGSAIQMSLMFYGCYFFYVYSIYTCSVQSCFILSVSSAVMVLCWFLEVWKVHVCFSKVLTSLVSFLLLSPFFFSSTSIFTIVVVTEVKAGQLKNKHKLISSTWHDFCCIKTDRHRRFKNIEHFFLQRKSKWQVSKALVCLYYRSSSIGEYSFLVLFPTFSSDGTEEWVL